MRFRLLVEYLYTDYLILILIKVFISQQLLLKFINHRLTQGDALNHVNFKTN